MRKWIVAAMGGILVANLFSVAGYAAVDDDLPASQPGAAGDSGNRYGPLDWYDHRSVFGTGFFPEPFLVDEGDLDKEVALSWLHQEGHGSISDMVTAEVEWTFGLTTIEVEVPYERDTFPGVDPVTLLPQTERTEGMDAVQATVRHPVWQYVSEDQKVDNTISAGVEFAAPTNSPVGKDTEIVPEVFDLLRLGDHFGLQTHVGFSTLLGSAPSDKNTMEYSADFSYTLSESDMPLPHGLNAIVPIIELAGERGLNSRDFSDELSGVVGTRFSFDAIGDAAPRLGFGFILPVDEQARRDFSWGVVTSLVFDL